MPFDARSIKRPLSCGTSQIISGCLNSHIVSRPQHRIKDSAQIETQETITARRCPANQLLQSAQRPMSVVGLPGRTQGTSTFSVCRWKHEAMCALSPCRFAVLCLFALSANGGVRSYKSLQCGNMGALDSRSVHAFMSAPIVPFSACNRMRDCLSR